MIYDLPEDVRRGLELARKRDLARKHRLRVEIDGENFRVLRFWKTGFSLDADQAPNMRGLVDIYDGPRHLYQCLVMCSTVSSGERVFEFKRHTRVVDQPPVDFEQDKYAPVALLN
ncbi:MAG: hypothetical protein KDA67_07560 [Rhodobacteraceae bacterium]|nr:hypothetical protein [Paracoccaceae bacterium]